MPSHRLSLEIGKSTRAYLEITATKKQDTMRNLGAWPAQAVAASLDLPKVTNPQVAGKRVDLMWVNPHLTFQDKIYYLCHKPGIHFTLYCTLSFLILTFLIHSIDICCAVALAHMINK